MSELRDLHQRLEAALSQIEGGLAQSAGSDGAELARAEARIAALEAENKNLIDDLASLKSAREADLGQLDGLIAQLRPLIEEAS